MKIPKKEQLERQLKTQVLNLVDDLIEICPDDYEIVLIKGFLDQMVDEEELMKSFIEHVIPWKNEIQNRDEDFFKNNEHVFGLLPEAKVKHFKNLWVTNFFDNDDKRVIWDYFTVYIKLATQHME
jgi:hypothetical protein